MYIKKYWGNYIGGTDDSLNLIAYLEDKKKTTLGLAEVLEDLGLGKLDGNYTQTTVPLEYTRSNGVVMDFHYAIDIVTDLAAILLECQKNGGVGLHQLDAYLAPGFRFCLTATPEEARMLNAALKHFEENPLAYDLSEMMPRADVEELAALCGQLRRELAE